jgi:hypothetical protein
MMEIKIKKEFVDIQLEKRGLEEHEDFDCAQNVIFDTDILETVFDCNGITATIIYEDDEGNVMNMFDFVDYYEVYWKDKMKDVKSNNDSMSELYEHLISEGVPPRDDGAIYLSDGTWLHSSGYVGTI